MVLIANDQEWTGRSLESILAPEGWTVVRAYNGHQALQRAAETAPDLIILDYQMPDLSGIEVCRAIRQDPRFGAAVPIVLTTASQIGRPHRREAFEAGAWDFFTQPLDGELLLLKLRSYLAAKRAGDHQVKEALVDLATGLYTLSGLARRGRELGAEAARHHRPLACIVILVEPGHRDPGPDPLATITETADVLRKSCRLGDALGRIGPSQFGWLAPGAGTDGARRIAERLVGGEETEPAGARLRVGYCAMEEGTWDPAPMDLLGRASDALAHADRRVLITRAPLN
jgi:PleD family two-component response regulator